MEKTYKCPRCGGTDIYFAKRQRITGLGGVYGNRAKMVDTPLCRACGEIADEQANSSELKSAKVAARIVAPLVKPLDVFRKPKVRIITAVAILALLFLFGL